MMVMKYEIVEICPIPSNGGSTVFVPIHDSITAIDMNVHVFNFSWGEIFTVFFFFMGIVKRAMEATNAMTPPSLDGMERRIA
jgi:hypothetical protein